jgi:hypothetical protein
MRWRIPLVVLLVSLAVAPAAAQANTGDADAREVQAYTLTMPKLRQLNQAMLDLRKQDESDPAYRALQQKKKELAVLGEKEEPTEADQDRMAKLEEEIQQAEGDEDDGADDNLNSLSDLEKRMASDPRIAGALKRAGLAPREAAVMQFALFGAGFAATMLESGTIKEIPKDVNAANVKFYQANKAELEAMTGLNQDKEDEE